MNYFERRRLRKRLDPWLHAMRHVRAYQEDILPNRDLALLDEQIGSLVRLHAAPEQKAVEAAGAACQALLGRIHPPKPQAGVRENLEMLVVALVVAMAVRTYFLQPFKIPTGSMQPTLYGVTMQPPSAWPALDRLPLSILKFVVIGDRTVEIRAPASGVLKLQGFTPQQPGGLILGARRDGRLKIRSLDASIEANIYQLRNGGGSLALPIPPQFKTYFRDGDYVQAGQLLAAGNQRIGDHVFVDKVRYNFSRPRRGDIIVFDTQGIRHPDVRQDTFYIKRLVGLPGDTIAVSNRALIANGKRVATPYAFERLVTDPRYRGYGPVGLLATAGEIRVPGDCFLPFGDNTDHSLDGRFFGPVKETYLVGPAAVIHWPFSRRWGIVR